MNMQDMCPDDLTKKLLMENGKIDRERGISKEAGWTEICNNTGLSDERTPAREIYEDGYYSV